MNKIKWQKPSILPHPLTSPAQSGPISREQLLTIYCHTLNHLKYIKYLSMCIHCLEHPNTNVIILHVLLCSLFSHFTINHGQLSMLVVHLLIF